MHTTDGPADHDSAAGGQGDDRIRVSLGAWALPLVVTAALLFAVIVWFAVFRY